MKKTKITIILGWMVFLCSNLFAQNTEGLFNLKQGDWFEVQVEQNYNSTLETKDQLLKFKNGSSYLLNYQLQKQMPNKNQQYKVQLEHVKIIRNYGGKHFGYDSYYPAFDENRTEPAIKEQFKLEVTPKGEIIRFMPFKTNKSPQFNLTEIGSAYREMSTATYSESNSDSLMIRIFSNYLMLPDSLTKTISRDSESRIPLLIKLPDMQLQLTDASFPLTNNAIILGRVKEQSNQEIRISMIGESSDYYFPEKHFKTQTDGSFICPIFLKRPLHLRIQVGNQTLTTFMEPGDTLNISAIGHQSREVQNNQYADTKPNGYYAPELQKWDYFSGKAAYNTMLSNELDQYRNGFIYEKEVDSVVTNEKKTKEAVKQLIESYRGKASSECISYFESDFKFFLAVAKLYFEEDQQSAFWQDMQNHKFPNTTDRFPEKDYPTDFFLEVDTMPILMNPFEWNSSYRSFIQKTKQFKQKRLGWAAVKRYFETFREDYFFSQASLLGFPLYSQIAYSINSELRKGQAEFDLVAPYFEAFINNCSDQALTEPLKKVYETANQLQIGNQFPITSFILPDSSIFNLKKLNGKPICLVLFDGPKRSLNQFKENIEKFKPEEVEFVFVRSTGNKYFGSELDSTIFKKPNVSYIELPEKYLKSELLLERTKIFMLDKWFRIVENNAEDPMSHKYTGRISEFEKSLQKTIETKRFSKAEKTAMIKTTGWSFGSIFFTFLIGLWIYRVRIRRIKQQEAAKRRIKELEIKAIRSQMNPHFIFNALNSIQSLINSSQFKEANIYLSKFAVLLRGVLNNSEKNRISLSDELQSVELYCQLEQLRFEFKFEISIDPDVNTDLIEIPGMIIQPLAENAVVHGLSAKGDLGKLDIQIKRQNGNLCVCISDNGVGLQSQKIDELSQKGFGLKLVEERINILNLDGKEAQLTVENRNNTAGTVAKLIIPID